MWISNLYVYQSPSFCFSLRYRTAVCAFTNFLNENRLLAKQLSYLWNKPLYKKGQVNFSLFTWLLYKSEKKMHLTCVLRIPDRTPTHHLHDFYLSWCFAYHRYLSAFPFCFISYLILLILLLRVLAHSFVRFSFQ